MTEPMDDRIKQTIRKAINNCGKDVTCIQVSEKQFKELNATAVHTPGRAIPIIVNPKCSDNIVLAICANKVTITLPLD